MSLPDMPLIIEPEALQSMLGTPGLLVVDLSKPETYRHYHVPGAVHLDYAMLVGGQRPAPGLLPEAAQLGRALSSIGLTPDRHVVAYDDEGGGRASRQLWSLDVIGHRHASLLNGGLHAWANGHFPLDTTPVPTAPGDCPVTIQNQYLADLAYIRAHLGDPAVQLLDARTPEEYQGIKVFAARGGHIPGAVNFNWTEAMDTQHNLRLKPAAALCHALTGLGLSPEREVITYCMTHHRSAHTYVVLKSLGFKKVKGYPGSWSEWGNLPDTPIET